MAQGSHVPKFGNWDKDNIPYTACFENARREKAGFRMNPNDPEENPEAFMYLTGGPGSHSYCYPLQASPHDNSKRSGLAGDHNAERYSRHRTPGISTSGHQKTGSHKRTPSESGSHKIYSDYSHQQLGHRQGKSDRKKGSSDGSNSLSPLVSGHSRHRSRSYASEETHQRSASIPKFGAWDETDPRSGEGFTNIFNKLKEEKQIASSPYPIMPPQPSSYSDSKVKHGGSSSKSKICCCLFSRRK